MLDLSEMKAVLASLGEDVSDEQLAAIVREFGENGTLSFQQFAQMMTKRQQRSDSREDVLSAFRAMAGSDAATTITGAQLRAVMSASDADALAAMMKRVGEDAFDFVDFVSSCFA